MILRPVRMLCGTFTNRYEGLVQLYHRDFFFWSVIIMLRNLGLSLIAVLMNDSPMRQAMFAIILLFIMLVAQLSFRPYREGKKFNELETTCLICEIFILFVGIIFFVRLDASFRTTDPMYGKHDISTKYPIMTDMFTLSISAAMAICTAVIGVLLWEQMKLPLRAALTKMRLSKQTNQVEAKLKANSGNSVLRLKIQRGSLPEVPLPIRCGRFGRGRYRRAGFDRPGASASSCYHCRAVSPGAAGLESLLERLQKG